MLQSVWLLTFSCCLTALFSRDNSWSSQVLQKTPKNLWGLLQQNFFTPDALPVTQPTVCGGK